MQDSQLVALAHTPVEQALDADHARHPLAAATQVRNRPPTQSEAPTAGQSLAHTAQRAPSHWPLAHVVGAAQVEQPFASTAHARSTPSLQTVSPAVHATSPEQTTCRARSQPIAIRATAPTSIQCNARMGA